MDISIRTRFGTLGIIAVAEEAANLSSMASARSFLASVPGSKVIIAHQGDEAVRINDAILSIPYQLLISDEWEGA